MHGPTNDELMLSSSSMLNSEKGFILRQVKIFKDKGFVCVRERKRDREEGGKVSEKREKQRKKEKEKGRESEKRGKNYSM